MKVFLPGGAGLVGLNLIEKIIEVHPDPSKAKSDASQQLNFREFKDLYSKIYWDFQSIYLVQSLYIR